MSEFVNDFLCPAPSAGSDVPLDVEKREAGVASSQTCRKPRGTWAGIDFGKRSMMLRA
jgi:hypothetical protein